MRFMIFPAAAALHLLLARGAWGAVNFAYEADQLQAEDTAGFPAIAFGDASATPAVSSSRPADPACKAQPEAADWPGEAEWARLNSSLGGALLNPSPPAIACYRNSAEYDQARCNWLLTNASNSRFYLDDPITVLSRWPQGDTCPLSIRPTGNCTLGGYPSYIVNATRVRHIQVAVNFARNNNIRLIIKNTGHDFVGKSSGKGSISIWTHNLKSFEFLPTFSIGPYSGMAARVGAGLESWEMYSHMRRHGIHMAVPGDSTVGPYGGWMAGGGHHSLASLFGIGADQPLSLQVVTADGRFVTADSQNNEDLFYALRGGGPSTYGIVTSAIVKAYPPLEVYQSPVRFSTTSINSTNAVDIFWAGVSATYWFSKYMTDEGGSVYDYISPSGQNGFTFTSDFEMPGFTASSAQAWMQTLYDSLNELGISVVNPPAVPSPRSNDASQGKGDVPGAGSRFGSRLFPRRNWENETLFDETMAAIRSAVEGGYTFHGIHITPKPSVAGWPGNGAGVNPAFRATQMHADLFDKAQPLLSNPARWMETWAELNSHMEVIRRVTPAPEGGSYVNEADRLEPDWQRSFYGGNYPRLLAIKKRRDPWGVFYAPTTPGSEEWEVRTADGLPTQNGPLCRVGAV